MRRFIIGLVVVGALAIAAVVFAVVNLNGFLEGNRERLTALASDAAGREVDFERASVAFSGGLAVRLDGLRVSEDPRFGESDFVRLESAYAGVDLWSALQGRVAVSGIRLEAPTLRIVQTAEGWNFDSLGGAAAEGPEAEPTDEESEPLALAIAALEIVDGTIVFVDRSTPDGMALVVEQFQSSGTDLSLTGPIAIDFEGRVRPMEGNVAVATQLGGRVEIDTLEPLAGRVRLESPAFFPGLLGLVFEEGGTLEHVDSLDIRVELPADAAKSGYPIRLQAESARLAGFDFGEIDFAIRFRDEDLSIDRAAIDLAGGRVEVAGDVALGDPGSSPFDLKTKIRDLDSGELAAVLLDIPRGTITGSIGGDVDLAGDGLEWESLKQSLIGQIRLDVGEGALERVNVLDNLVGRLVADPGLGVLVANSIRDAAPQALEGNRTPFDGVNMAIEVVDGALRADEFTIETGDFAIAAAGTLGLDGALSGKGTIRFSDSLSQDILAKADRLAPLLGDGDRVEFPLRFGGAADSPRVLPDLKALASSARATATKELKQQVAKKLTDAIFGRKEDDEKRDGEEPSEPGAGDPPDARELLEDGLKGLFGR